MKNILILAESLRINETSSGIVSSTFISVLAKRYNVSVLYVNDFKYPVTWLERVTLFPMEYTSRKQFFFEKIPKIRGLPSILYGNSMEFRHKVRIWKEAIRFLLKKNNYDLIVALGSGISFLPHWSLLEIKSDIPVIMNFHDPYPVSWYPLPYRKKRNWIYMKQEQVTKRIVKRADCISFPSYLLRDMMITYLPTIKEKSFVFPHIGTRLIKLPESEHDHEVRLPLSPFKILHAGTLLEQRKADYLLEAFRRLQKEDKEFLVSSSLTFIGKVNKENYKIIQNNNIKNVHFIDKRLSYKRTLELLQEVELALVIEAAGDFSPFMPGKLADIFYREKPVLALTPEVSEVRRILGVNYPYMAEPNDVDGIYDALKKAWLAWKSGKLNLPDVERLQNYVSPESFLERFDKMLSHLGLR